MRHAVTTAGPARRRVHRALSAALVAVLAPALVTGTAWLSASAAHAAVSVLPDQVAGTTVVAPIGAPEPIGPRGALARDPRVMQEVRAYRDSGAYANDQREIAQAASAWLDTWRATSCTGVCRPALVVDVDDTLLDWYPTYRRWGFGPSSATMREAGTRCLAPAIAPVRSLVQQAHAAGVRIIVLTGRREEQRAQTARCLRAKGVPFDALILRSRAEESLTATDYKSAERAGIERQGWSIGLSIGDQVSDLAGGHAARGFLLPNPLYRNP